MSPDRSAQLALAVYVLIAAALMVRNRYASGLTWSAWFLYMVQRAYSGLWLHWRSNRRCPFPSVGPAIIYANHRSPIDPMMIWTNHHLVPSGTGKKRVIGFLMAREYYELPVIGWICRSVESIPADRNGRDIGPAKEALSRLKAGRLVGIFPEGRLNRGEGLLPFGSGAAWLALRADVPVFPVYIHEAPQGSSMVMPFLYPTRVRVSYGPPIDLTPYRDRPRDTQTVNEVTDLMRRKLAELGGVAIVPAQEN